MSIVNAAARPIAALCERVPLATAALRRTRFRGRSRIVSQLRFVPGASEIEADCGGVRFALDLRDDVQREIYFGCYEECDLALALRYLPPGSVCLDVGANVGFYTLHMARRVGEEGVVHSFEPDPANAARLRRNAALNRDVGDRIRVHEMAVAGRAGRATLYRSAPGHSGWGSLTDPSGSPATAEVEVTTVDSFLAGAGIDRVDFLKADVEGAECDLLEGAAESLGRQVIRALLVEFNGPRLARQGKTLEDFLAPFMRAGYAAAPESARLVAAMESGKVAAATVWPNLLFVPRR